MCHHYSLDLSPEAMIEIYQVGRIQYEISLGPEFFPLSYAPVIRLDSEGERELVAMQWGILPSWWKQSPKSKSRKSFQRKCFNARSETAHEKPTFRAAFKHRRCLIPVTRFEEKENLFALKSQAPFAFAGLWERWKSDDEIVESYTFLTTEPNGPIKSVGHHRMPIILRTSEEWERWISPDIIERQPLEYLFDPLEDDELQNISD